MSDPSPPVHEPHPLAFEVVSWARSMTADGKLPPPLVDQLSALSEDERERVLKDVAGFGAALAQTGRPQPAILVLHALRQLIGRFATARAALQKPVDMLCLAIALSIGDLDRVLELWPRLIPGAEDQQGPVELLEHIRAVRERLKPSLGESRANALAVILMPVQPHTVMTALKAEPWLLSDECRTVMTKIEADASPALKEQLRHMGAALDDVAGRSTAAQARREAGVQRAQQLIGLAAPLRELVEPERLLAAADQLSVPVLSSDEGEELVRALSDSSYETIGDIIPLWLAWRAAQQSGWNNTDLAPLAMELMRGMKPLGEEHAVARRRRILGEFALQHLPAQAPTESIALLYYGLTHTFVTLSEFEGDTPELLGGQYVYARRALHLFMRIADLGFAAQCLDLMIAAQSRLPAEQGGGLSGVRGTIETLLSPKRDDVDGEQTDPMPPAGLMRATLLTARARLRNEDESLTDEVYQRACADLDEAFQIFSKDSDKHARESAVRICFYRAGLERRWGRHGKRPANEEAKRWSERGLGLINDDEDPHGVAMLAMTYMQSLREDGEHEAASAWVQRALAMKRLPPTMRAGFFIDRANLRLDAGEPLASSLQDVAAARTLLDSAPNAEQQWYLVRTEVELYRQHGQMGEALDAALRGQRTWEKIFVPKHRTSLRAETISLLQRSKRPNADQHAEQELDLLLGETGNAPPEALRNIQNGAWQWLYFQCLSSKDKGALRYSGDRERSLRRLTERSGPKPDLGLLIDIWRGRATGEPSIAELFARLDAALVAQPERARSYLGLGFFLAVRETPDDSLRRQAWAKRLEAHLLTLKPEDGDTGAVDFLLTLALDRLRAGPPPTLVSTQAAARLLAQAKHLFPVERLSPSLRRRLSSLDLRTRLRLLGLTPKQDPHELVLAGQFLERETTQLSPDDRMTFIGELHHWLVSYAAVDPAPLRQYARQLRENYGVGEEDQEEAADLLDNRKLSKKDLRELQQLRELGVPKELAKNLLRGESLAQAVIIHATAGDEAQAVLTPLLGQCAAAQDAAWRPLVTARVHRALGWMWMRHKSQERRRVLTNAILHFEQATSLWPMSDPEGFLDISEEYASALWEFEPTDLKERAEYAARARAVIRTALSHSQADKFPADQAMLYRLLGLVEQYEERYIDKRDPERGRRAIGYHEKALELCPSADLDTHFQVLVTLANACRDFSSSQSGEQTQRALLERSIDVYRQALAVVPKLQLTLPTEPARAQQCLAEALRHRANPGDFDEARTLIRQSLEIRTERHFPVARAESLLRLAQLELDCHRQGNAGALDAAREAAVECQALVAQKRSPAVEQTVGALLREIDRALGETAVDATGRGTPGKPLLAHRLDEAEQGKKDLPPLDPRIPRQMSWEGKLGDSLLAKVLARHISQSLILKDEIKNDNQPAAKLSAVLPIIEESRQAGDVNKARRFLVGALSPLCGNPQDHKPDERRRLADLAYQLLTPEYLDSLSWQEAALLRHQAAHVLHGSWSGLSDADWQWTEDAERAAVRALESHAADDPCMPEYWKSLGLILWKRPHGAFRQRYREALDLFERALTLACKQNQLTMALSLRNDLATILDELAHEEPPLRYRAISYYSQIIEQCEKGAGSEDYHQMVLGNRGWSQINLPREAQPQGYRDAVSDLEQALKICSDNPYYLRNRVHHYDHLGLAHTGLIKREDGHVDKAIECFAKSIELAQKLPDPIEESRALHNLGLLYLDLGGEEEIVESEKYLWAALEPRRGRVKEEWETLGTLLAVRTRRPVPFGELAHDGNLLAALEALAPRLVESEEYDKALQTYDYIFELIRHRPGRTYRELIGHTNAALELAEKVWSRAERPAAQHHYARHIATLASRRTLLACLDREPAIEILKYSQQGKARTLSWHRGIQLGALPPAIRSYQVSMLAQISRLRASDRPEDRATAMRLETELHQRLQEYATGQKVSPKVLTDDLLIAWLRRFPKTALVDVSLTAVGGVITRAFLGRSGQLCTEARHIDLTLGVVEAWLHGDQNDQGWLLALDRLGHALSEKKQDALALLDVLDSAHALCLRVLPQLYARLAAPMTADLHAHGIIDLVVCMPGILASLPLAAACRLGADGTPRYLIEDFRSLKLTPSIDLLVRATHKDRILRRAVAVLTEDSLAPPATVALEQLTTTWRHAGMGVRNLRAGGSGQDKASAAAVLQALSEADLVHILCHGSFDPNAPHESGIHLADEILSIEQLMSHLSPSPAQAVTLAACRSGRTSTQDVGAEWLGVSGALLRIGVRSVVAALWDVEVGATLRLYHDFYAAYLTDTSDTGTALATAMRNQLAKGRAGEAGGIHPLTNAAPIELQPRLRRVCASPLFWAGLTVLLSG